MAQPRAPVDVAVGSRTLHVPCAAGRVARFSFADLCNRPLGAADYLALTERFHTLFLDGVPVLAPNRRNEARRFMTLVDALYERRMMLFLSAAAPAERLYPTGDGAFEFQRTVSRLLEMQSRDWLARLPRAPPRGAAHDLRTLRAHQRPQLRCSEERGACAGTIPQASIPC